MALLCGSQESLAQFQPQRAQFQPQQALRPSQRQAPGTRARQEPRIQFADLRRHQPNSIRTTAQRGLGRSRVFGPRVGGGFGPRFGGFGRRFGGGFGRGVVRFGPRFGRFGSFGFGSFRFGTFGFGGPVVLGGSSVTVLPYGSAGVGPYSLYGPLVLPSETLFGVSALPPIVRPPYVRPQLYYTVPPISGTVTAMRDLGPLPGAGGRILPGEPGGLVQRKPQPDIPAPNEAALEKASQAIARGDAHFAQQKYAQAYREYASARVQAVGWGEVHFRRGWALLALHQWPEAAEAFRLGLSLKPNWPESRFLVGTLFQDRREKLEKFQRISQAQQADANNRDLALVMGIFLYFDNQREASQQFFTKAAELGEAPEHLQAFEPQENLLPRAAPQKVPQQRAPAPEDNQAVGPPVPLQEVGGRRGPVEF